MDTLSVHSDAMNKEVQVITICPDKEMCIRDSIRISSYVRRYSLVWMYVQKRVYTRSLCISLNAFHLFLDVYKRQGLDYFKCKIAYWKRIRSGYLLADGS